MQTTYQSPRLGSAELGSRTLYTPLSAEPLQPVSLLSVGRFNVYWAQTMYLVLDNHAPVCKGVNPVYLFTGFIKAYVLTENAVEKCIMSVIAPNPVLPVEQLAFHLLLLSSISETGVF